MKTIFYFLSMLIFVFVAFFSSCGKNKEYNSENNKDSTQTISKNEANKEEKIDERWKYYFTDDKNNKYYYDTKTIKHKKKDAKSYSSEGYNVWRMIIFDKEQIWDYNNNDNDFLWCIGKKYKEIIAYIWLDCDDKITFTIEKATYFVDGEMLNESNFKRVQIRPESSSEKLYELLCGNKNQ